MSGRPAPDDGARTESKELTIIAPIGAALSPREPIAVDLIGAFLSGRNPRTLAAYGRDLDDFTRFVAIGDRRAATELLLLGGHGNANALALGWRSDMLTRKLSPATIGRRLSSLRSFVKMARMLGRVAWSIEVEAPKAERLRDTRGPGREGWKRMRAAAELAGDGAKARRDLAIVRLLRERALRRGELVALDLDDFDPDPERPSISIIGKGRTQRERLGIAVGTSGVVARWVEARGDHPGPLFVRLDPGDATRAGRLTGEAIRRIVASVADSAGISGGCRPHGLRHEAITAALESGRDVLDVAKFSRHRDIKTLQVYDDRRKDVGSDIAAELGE